MDNRVKQEMASIPIPSDLHRRSRLGVELAIAENKPASNLAINPARKRRRTLLVLTASLLGLVLLTAVLSNSQVRAAIQKALQFVPGIGIVKEEELPADRYVLKNPITQTVGSGTIVITGVMVDSRMTLVSINGENTARLDKIKIINDQGAEFIIKPSLSTWSSGQWQASYGHQGELDLKGSVSIVVGEEGKETVIPITLIKAETFTNYADMGATSTVNGVTITAITNRVDEKARISLIAQHPKEIRITDYGFFGLYAHDNLKMNVTDNIGNSIPLEIIRGILAPASDFYFKLSDKRNITYKLTLPEIYTETQDEATITIPTETTDNLNQTFEIAGFPVTITGVERLDEKNLRVYVDMHYSESTTKSLHMFNLAGLSNMGRLNERTGELVYLEFEAESNRTKQKITISRPQILIRGPWTFELPTFDR
ncbi:hypothetical protein [Cohnella abietis]|uniref:DUF4179 domain-containing protein n=1 Tax=Cohnella abietis TaxID=2507935 RepID=A0A3T1CYZ4_9BACL|nr:hypothetical protein [Cohnella abietis]BBI31031.1 hypothetical protein KCTCHS21_04300 [Cohnella abietis]